MPKNAKLTFLQMPGFLIVSNLTYMEFCNVTWQSFRCTDGIHKWLIKQEAQPLLGKANCMLMSEDQQM